MKVSGGDKCLAFDVGERWLTQADYYNANIQLDEMPSTAVIDGYGKDAEIPN